MLIQYTAKAEMIILMEVLETILSTACLVTMFISGDSGDDRIDGGSGNDKIDAGFGNDVVRGGYGSDSIQGGWGNDSLSGDGGDDVIVGDPVDILPVSLSRQTKLHGGGRHDRRWQWK